MNQIQRIVSVETDHHVIEVTEGCLTIGMKSFPDDCICLTPEEAERTLHALLQWKAGMSLLPSSTSDRETWPVA